MIRLHVKGDKSVAEQECQKRNIPATFVSEGKSGTYWDAPETNRDKIITWSCEAGNVPFPAGTLLYHN